MTTFDSRTANDITRAIVAAGIDRVVATFDHTGNGDILIETPYEPGASHVLGAEHVSITTDGGIYFYFGDYGGSPWETDLTCIALARGVISGGWRREVAMLGVVPTLDGIVAECIKRDWQWQVESFKRGAKCRLYRFVTGIPDRMFTYSIDEPPEGTVAADLAVEVLGDCFWRAATTKLSGRAAYDNTINVEAL